MKESILISLFLDGSFLPIDEISKGGVRLFGESSAWPRRTTLRLTPANNIVRARLDMLRPSRGWGPHEIKLKRKLDGQGRLRLTGVNQNALPPGPWVFDISIYDLRGARRRRISIPEDGQCDVRVSVRKDPRTIQVKPKSNWAAQIRRVLDNTTLDGVNGADWVRRPDVRAGRQACVMNILAVCRELGLIKEMKKIFMAEVDRIYAEVERGFEALLDDRFGFDGPPGHPIHKKLVEHLPAARRKKHPLKSYRQKRNPSLQVVTAFPKDGRRTCFAELDLDLGNIRDPLGFIIHTLEVLNPKRTDSMKLRDRLANTGAGRFLIYET